MLDSALLTSFLPFYFKLALWPVFFYIVEWWYCQSNQTPRDCSKLFPSFISHLSCLCSHQIPRLLCKTSWERNPILSLPLKIFFNDSLTAFWIKFTDFLAVFTTLILYSVFICTLFSHYVDPFSVPQNAIFIFVYNSSAWEALPAFLFPTLPFLFPVLQLKHYFHWKLICKFILQINKAPKAS